MIPDLPGAAGPVAIAAGVLWARGRLLGPMLASAPVLYAVYR